MSDETSTTPIRRRAPTAIKSLVSLLTEWEKPLLYFGLVALVMQHGAVPDRFVGSLGFVIFFAMFVRALRVALS